MLFNARTRRSRVLIAVATAAVVAVAVAVTLALTVTTYEHTSPRTARNKASGSVTGDVDCRRAKCVALSFDGGPSATTPRLLDILKQQHLHATFFVQGRGHISKYPGILRRIAEEGEEIGNHTWTHPRLTDLDEAGARAELTRTQNAIERITGTRPVLMRPPEGRTDRTVAKVCRELGLAQVLWSVTAKDYETTDSALITKRVLEQTHRDGIILLHDLHKGTVPAVPGILKALKQRGYTVVTVSQLLAPAKPQPGMVYRP
ncbi:polysaccharide deacetylase family protein [Streptomyces sp900105755]|uniref:polysaccharide deacetylase family protein n=1 Tax=unclassified Streptomyces TaxID=2593676 RepID=UPI00089C7001|nr:polysaccharide deacetylase family protein [Streptomyces sp. Ag109_O5-10]SEF16822.1 Peptidoglycan/xylan/chitin deacetylase, PgdA/CDA1 family [Streptomyces sp. Ag109_O5-10]